jgi:hypothetical protein
MEIGNHVWSLTTTMVTILWYMFNVDAQIVCVYIHIYTSTDMLGKRRDR